jgi:Zn-dependent metalloprotease/subtilisin-like proprotein convertase family protein
MNRTIGTLFFVSAAALFTGCFASTDTDDSTSDDLTTAPVAAGTTVASAMWGKAPAVVSLAAEHAFAGSTADSLVASRPAFLQASPKDTFVRRSVTSSGGLSYVSYERLHGGLPVVGGDFVLVTDASGKLVHSSTARQSVINVASLSPTLSSTAAEAIAKRQLVKVDHVEGTQLVVNALEDNAQLVWETTVVGVGPKGPSRLTVHVDAGSGSIAGTQEHVLYGSGTSAWSGPNPVPLATTQSGTTFSMRDPAILNLSCQNAANNTTFSGTDDLWGNTDKTNRETGCVDALFGAQTEAKMLTQWLGRNAMDGAGGAWPIRVGLADVNAFYDGTQVQVGHNNANQWIASLDVIAHEMGHGIDDHTPGGISGGGTQEFVADTFGAATEAFANEPAPFDVPDFLVGEQINLVGSGPIRNMFNPSALGDANCFSAAIPTTEVHAAAGPGNHWFYLLAQGSNPTNGFPASSTCNGSTVTGLGTQTAITIMYNAMLLKTTGATYPKYRTFTLQAAKNLFPGSCTQFNTVKAAWDAVSVPAQAADPTCGSTPPPPPGCINGTQAATDVPKAIPDNNATGVTSTLNVVGDGTVASLALNLNLTHTFRGDLVVTLTAPDGTAFSVSNRAGGSADNIILTNSAIAAFNGHTAAGAWKLKVVDAAAQDVGTINSWSLNIVGSCTGGGGGTNWSGSATPNIATIDNGQVCSSLTVSTTGGDASLAKLSIAGRHDFCSILSGTLAHGGVTATAFGTGTFANGACNFSLTDRAVAGFSGDASGTWTFCLRDTDAFGDTGTLNSWSVHN